MDTLKFKTNLKCSGCIKSLEKHLNKISGIQSWSVDLENSDRILEIIGNNISDQEIIDAGKTAGYLIELI
jgi:copper chaperone